MKNTYKMIAQQITIELSHALRSCETVTFFFFFFFFKFKCNFIYNSNTYTTFTTITLTFTLTNMLANYTTYTYNTYTRGTLLILTLLIHEVPYLYMHYFTIRDDLRKYETTYNTILMLLRNDTNTAVQLLTN